MHHRCASVLRLTMLVTLLAGMLVQPQFPVLAAATNITTITIPSTPAGGAALGYTAGEVITIRVTFTAAETVTGAPSILINVGGNLRKATYASGSGTASLDFAYTVVAGDADANGISITANSLALNGGAINNGTDAAQITHAAVADQAADMIAAAVAALDVTAPVLRSAVGAGSTITIFYDELGSGLRAAPVPPLADFTFTRSGGGPLSVTSVSINHTANTVTLGLNGLINLTDTNMRVSYTANGTNDLQDVAGNKAANFSNVFVANTMPSFDVKGNTLSFDNPSSITGNGLTAGNKILFSNIITVDGQSIDAIVTTTALTAGTTLAGFDTVAGTTATPALTGTPAALDALWFKLNSTIGAAGGDVTITFDFIKGGSYNAANLTATKGDDVILQNVVINSYDLDGAGGGATQFQYQEFGGFATYTVANNSALTQSKVGALTHFQTTTGGNVTSSPGTDAGDQIRVMALYEAIHQFQIKTGAIATGGTAYYYLDFSKGANWFNPTLTYQIPTVNPKVTNDTTPDLTGTFVGTAFTGGVPSATVQAYTLTVTVNGKTYTAGEVAGERTTLGNGDIQLLDVTSGLRGVFNPTTGVGTWALTIPPADALPLATYDVNVDVGYGTSLAAINKHTLDDTTNELVINGTPPDTTAPAFTSITRGNPPGEFITPAALAIQNYVDFTVTFSEAVTNVDLTDFQITGAGSTGSNISSVTQTGPTTYTVRVSNIPTTNSGILDLNLLATTDIVDLAGNLLSKTIDPVEGVSPTSGIDETYYINQSADLVVTKTDGVPNVNTGGTTTYTVRVTNNGPSSVTGAVLSDPVASGLNKTAVACSATPGQCVTAPTIPQLEGGAFALPALANGQFYELRITATVTAASGTVSNAVTVTPPVGVTDPTPANNTNITDTNTVDPAPDLTVTKTNNTTNGWTTTGGTFQWTLTARNGAAAGTASFANTDVILSDTLPAGQTYGAVTVTNGTPAPTGTINCSITGTALTCAANGAVTLPANASFSVSFNVTTAGTANLSNTATVDPGNKVPESNEANNTGSNTVALFDNAPSKIIVDTSEDTTTVGLDGFERVAIGEIVRYRVSMRMPEGGPFTNVQLLDNIPTGFQFLNDGTARIAFVSSTSGSITSAVSGTIPAITTALPGCGGLNVVGNSTTVTPTCPLPDLNVSRLAASNNDVYASGDDVYFKLGDFTNTENDSDNEYIVIEFNALTLNVNSGVTINQAFANDTGTAGANSNRDNNAIQRLNGANIGANSADARVIVAEPAITNVTKSVSAGPYNPGSAITYTVTFSNGAGGNNAATAFDLTVTDTLDANLTVGTVNISSTQGTSGVSTCAGGTTYAANGSTSGQTVTANISCLDPGASVTVTIGATIKSTATGGTNISNTGNVTYTSLPGAQGNCATAPFTCTGVGATGTGTGERDGSGGAGADTTVLNNFADSAVANFTVQAGTITIEKQTLPDGNAQSFTFTPTYNSGTPFNLTDNGTNASGNIAPGTYTVVESSVAGWSLTGLSCVGDTDNGSVLTLGTGTVQIDLDSAENITCTFTNTKLPTLTLQNTVVNDNGGTALDTAWTLNATQGTTTISGVEGNAAVTNAIVSTGTWTLSETSGPAGYTTGTWSCTGAADANPNDGLTLAAGENVTCTITNNDIAPSLTLVKTVTNDNSGISVPADWTLTATGASGTPTNLSGSTPVTSGAGFKADTYTLAESGPAGYIAGAWSCTNGVTVTGGQITLGLGQTTTCTINNNDVDLLPVANPDTNSATEGGPAVNGNVRDGGVAPGDAADNQGDPVATVTAASQGANPIAIGMPFTTAAGGTLTLNADGTYSYTPPVSLPEGGALTEVFNYTITDADGDTSSTTLTITVDRLPQANPDTNTATEGGADAAGNVITNDDEGNTNATVTSAGQGANPITLGTPFTTAAGGTLTLHADGTYTYAPPATLPEGGALTEVFNYTITDNDGDTSSSTLTITVDRLPQANPDTNTATEGGADAVGNVITNDDEGNINAAVTSAAQGANPIAIGIPFTTTAGGTLTLNVDGSYSYTPPAQGSVPPGGLTEVFTYTITDNDGDPSSSTLTITVNDNDLLPVANPDTNTAVENGPAVNGNVRDGGVSAGDAADNQGDPTATLTAADQGGSAITLGTPFITAAGGTLTLNANGTYSYTPPATLPEGGLLTEVFNYTITDADGDTSSTTLTITVDRLPQANPDTNAALGSGPAVTGNTITNDDEGNLNATVTAADQGGTTLIIGTPFTTAGGGTLTLNTDGSYSYTPPAAGSVPPAGLTEVFNYAIADADGDVSSSTLTITVTAVPTINVVDDTETTTAGTPVTTLVTSNDTSVGATIDPTSVNVTVPPASGTVVCTGASCIYTPPTGFAGIVTYTYQVCLAPPNAAVCDTAVVTVTVTPTLNAVDDDYSASPISGLSGGTTPPVIDNDTTNGVAAAIGTNVTLTPGSAPAPVVGSITMNPTGTITVAAGTTAGTYTYPYTICTVPATTPATCDTATATVKVGAATIAAVNDNYSGTPLDGTTGGNAGNAFTNDTLNGVAVIPAQVTAAIVTPPSNPGVSLNLITGSVDVAPGTPAGTYTIGYKICENLNPTNCDTATITVVVNPPASIGGVVFNDVNLDGSKAGSEAGLAGVTVNLYDSTGVTLLATTTTGPGGTYNFPNRAPGNYLVVEADPAGYVSSTANSVAVTVAAGGAGTANFGDYQLPNTATSSISGVVFNDANANGTHDATELPISGVTVQLKNNLGAVIGTVVTGATGTYNFPNLAAGTYTVTETDLAGYLSTTLNNVVVNLSAGTNASVNYGDQLSALVIADPAVTKFGTPANAKVGDTVVYTITVGNNGGASAANVILTDTKPAFLDIINITISPNPGLVPVITGNTFTINFGTVNPTDLYTVTVVTRVNALGLPPGGANTVQIASLSGTDRLFNNVSAAGLTIDPANKPSTSSALPATGFAPNVVTALMPQPENLRYAATDIVLEIPSLGIKLPIVGVPKKNEAWDVAWLGNQAGWLEGTAFPSWNGNSVLTGHVYLSNGLPGPFVNLGKLKYGDVFIIHAYGQKYTFEVSTNVIVNPNDTSAFKHEEKSWLTLVTCKEYDEKTNTYKKRVVVRAVLVKAEAE